MVQFVNELVEGTIVESLVSKVVPDIFEDEEKRDLGDHCPPRGERDMMSLEAEHFANGVEEPDL